MTKQIIAVAGATGNQGGSVLKALANDPKYEVRALTRNADTPHAKELLKYGPKIVLQQCDLTDEASLSAALKGAYGFFAMTNYFAHRIESEDDIKEEAEGRFMADVAKKCGVTHIIWSTLPEVKERSGGKWTNVHHFDGKYRVQQYISGLGFKIASYVCPCAYVQNLTAVGSSRIDKDGTVIFSMPFPSAESNFPVCDIAHDMGPVVKAILNLGPSANQKLFPIIGEFTTPQKLAAEYTKVTGQKARFEAIPKDVWINIISPRMGRFVAIDLWEMFQAYDDIGFGEAGEPENLNNTKQLGVHLNTWIDYLEQGARVTH